MRKPMVSLVSVGVLLALISIALLFKQQSHTDESQLHVVTTSTPITLIVEPIVGSVAQLDQLIPSGQEIHDFQATPRDVSLVEQADLVVANGAGLETSWLDPLLQRAGVQPAGTVVFSDELAKQGVSFITGSSNESGQTDGVLVNPHLWLDPTNVERFVPVLRDALIARDPAHTQAYQENAVAFLAELKQLDTNARESFSALHHHEFIAFHEAFNYFARTYSLSQVASIEATPGEAPTPGDIIRIRDAVDQYGIRGLFIEPEFSGALVTQLAADLGVSVEVLDPMETRAAGDTYQSIMQRNVETLVGVLSKE